jgi:hypothetical protein
MIYHIYHGTGIMDYFPTNDILFLTSCSYVDTCIFETLCTVYLKHYIQKFSADFMGKKVGKNYIWCKDVYAVY